jgi:hypothetical protein
LDLIIWRAAEEKPGEPSARFLYLLSVLQDGKQFLKELRRKLYAFAEYPANVIQNIMTLLEYGLVCFCLVTLAAVES